MLQLSAQVDRSTISSSKPRKQDPDEKLAMQYYRDKDYSKAVILFERLYKKDQHNRYYTYYFQCLTETNNLKEAEKIARKQIRKNPGYYKYYIDLGYIYSLMDETKKAQETFNEVLETLPPNENLISQIANSFLYRNQNDLALKTLKKGKELVNKKYAFNLELASIYYRTGNFEDMINEYLNYVQYDKGGLKRIQNRLQFIMDGLAGRNIKELLKKELLRRNQQNPDVVQYSEMLLWLSIQDKDFEFALVQAKAIDRRFNENGSRVFNLAELCNTNKDYTTAEEAFGYLIKKGESNPFYLNARIGLLQSRYHMITGNPVNSEKDIRELEKDYEKTLDELGKNPFTIQLIRDFAHLKAFFQDDLDYAASLLKEALEIPGTRPSEIANCKLELGDINLFKNAVWEATLLYSQVDKAFKNEPLGHEAKLRNARLFYYIGEFGWAKAQLDILKAATSKLIANDAMELSLIIFDNTNADSTTTELQAFANADLLFYQNKKQEALAILDSLHILLGYHPIKDDILFKKGEIFSSLGDYETADSLYAEVVSGYSYDILADNALFQRAKLNEIQLDRKDIALKLYQEILTEYPGSIFTIEARKRYRSLRGDEL